MSPALRLLMVEDSEEDAELLLRELRRGGCAVTAERVETPAAMRAALERQAWDIVISDHAMPKFSAPAALALLKEVRPQLPFVIVSNEIDLNLAVSLMKAGAQDYIQKRELAQVGPAIQRELREVEDRRQRQNAQAALRESEKRYRDLVEFLPEAIFEADLQGKFTLGNRLAYDMFGYTDDDLRQGLSLYQMIPPEEHGRARANIGRLLQGEKRPPSVYLARRKDGRVFPVEITSVIIRQDGQPVALRGVMKDISERQNLIHALGEAHSMLEAAFEQVPVPFMLVRASDGIIQVANSACREFLGLSGESSPVGRSLFELEPTWADCDVAGNRPMPSEMPLALALKHIATRNKEYPFQRKDGTVRWSLVTAAPIYDQAGKLIAAFSVFPEITGHKHTEVLLQAKNEELRQEQDLFMAGPIMVIRWLPGPTWPVTYVSPNLFTHFGYLPEDLISGRLAYTELMHPDDRPGALENDRRFAASGQDWYEQDYRLRRADGQYRWVHDFTRPIRGPDGVPEKFHGYLSDITDSRQAAAELEQRQQELATIGQLASAIATNLNLEEILDQALRGALDLTGLEGGNVCLVQPGRPTLVLSSTQGISPARLADLNAGEVTIGDCLCGETAQSGTPQFLWDAAARCADGFRFHASFPLNVKGQTIGVLCLSAHSEARPTQRSLDLVQQLCGPIALAIDNARLYAQAQRQAVEMEQRVVERTVELAAANQELEAFSYSVAHDLRVPLRSIDGYSQALLEDCADKLEPKSRRHLERIRAAAQRMHRLIDDLLELSRLARGDLERLPLDLSALAQAIAAELQQRVAARQVEFVIAPDIVARADAPLMRAVLENLLGNAWKFTGNVPAARIEFGEQRRKREGQEERIYFVRDNGAGFDMAQADKLFQIFQRLHSQEEFPGTGIGLATVKQVIRRHGGRVWAEGAEGQGATFYFTL